MNFSDLFKDTFETLWAHKLRTFLTMFGITWGIISITLMVAATEGLRVGLKRNSESFGKDIMIFFSGRTSMQAGGMRAGRDVHWYEDDYQSVHDQSPACRYAMPEIGNQVQLRSRYNSGNLDVSGSLPPFAEVRSLDVGEGRFYDDEDHGERQSGGISRQRHEEAAVRHAGGARRNGVAQRHSVHGDRRDETEGPEFVVRRPGHSKDFCSL